MKQHLRLSGRILVFILPCFFFFACRKSQVDDFISLSKDHIDLNCLATTVPIVVDVKSNAQWSISINYEDSQIREDWVSVTNADPDNPSKLNVSTKENRQQQKRVALIIAKTTGGVADSLKITQEGMSPELFYVKVGHYNLRVEHGDRKDPVNVWSLRKPRLFESIHNIDFDIVGVTEVTSPPMIEDIEKEFSEKYEMLYFAPSPRTDLCEEDTGIYYKKSMFELVNRGHFWIGEDNEHYCESGYWAGKPYANGGLWCILKHKDTGRDIFILCSHPCNTDDGMDTYAYQYARLEKKFNPNKLPSFFVGDLNTVPSSLASMTYRYTWNDPFMVLDNTQVKGPESTLNNYAYVNGVPDRRLDYVYYKGKVEPLLYTCDNSLYDGCFPSDHFPVYVNFVVL